MNFVDKLVKGCPESWCPIPPSEQGIPTVTAEYFHQITKEQALHMEGLCFDRNRDLFFVGITEGRIYKLDMQTKKQTVVAKLEGIKPTAVKVHKDGRLFVCFVGVNRGGGIIVMDPDGSNQKEIVSDMDVDDLVFDTEGGFYFTYYVGNAYNPIGGVYYMDPDLETYRCVIDHMAKPNGIAISKDGKGLWITETDLGRLVWHPLPGTAGHTTVVYQFGGTIGPDSVSIDEEGNVYVALFRQGRFMIFNAFGFPIGQVLMPNRDKGHNLFTTHPMVHPDTSELYMIASDDYGDEGSWIFRTETFAKGNAESFQFAV